MYRITIIIVIMWVWNSVFDKAWTDAEGFWEASRYVYYPGRQYEKNVVDGICSSCEKVDIHKGV